MITDNWRQVKKILIDRIGHVLYFNIVTWLRGEAFRTIISSCFCIEVSFGNLETKDNYSDKFAIWY